MTKYNALTIAIDIMTTCAGPQDTDVEQAVEVISKMKESLLAESKKKRQYYVKKTCESPTQAASEFCNFMERNQLENV